MIKKSITTTLAILFTIGLHAQISDLIISEYVEGSGNNRAIELYNGTGNPVDLKNYRLERDLNGNGTFSYFYNLSGILEDKGIIVIGNPNASAELIRKATILHQAFTEFTGNDQIRLLKNGVEIDRIGIAGNINFAQNCTYVRVSTVTSPKSGEQNPKTNGEWTYFPTDSFNDLGIFFYATNSFDFLYDDTGNRKQRKCVILKSEAPEKQSTTEDIFTPKEVEPVVDTFGERSIQIYPNPTQGLLYIEITGSEESETHTYTLYGMNGSMILNGKGTGSNPIHIDMSRYTNGIYLLVIKSDGEQNSYKIIKE